MRPCHLQVVVVMQSRAEAEHWGHCPFLLKLALSALPSLPFQYASSGKHSLMCTHGEYDILGQQLLPKQALVTLLTMVPQGSQLEDEDVIAYPLGFQV